MPWKNLTFGPGRTRCLYMSKLFNLFSAITRFSFYLSTDLLEVGAVLFSWKRQQLLTAKPRRWRWCCTQRNMGPLEQPCPRWVWGIYSAKIVCNFQGLGGKKRKEEEDAVWIPSYFLPEKNPHCSHSPAHTFSDFLSDQRQIFLLTYF